MTEIRNAKRWRVGSGFMLAGGLLVGMLAGQPANASVTGTSTVVSGNVSMAGIGLSANVDLIAWPNEAVLADLPEGSSVPLLPVASTVAKRGVYSLSVDPAALPPTHVGSEGQVNFDVVVTTSTSSAQFSVPARNVEGKWTSASDGASTAAVAPTVSFSWASANSTSVAISSATSSGLERTTVATDSPSLEGGVSTMQSTATTSGLICNTVKRGLIYGVQARVAKAQGLSNVPVTVDFDSGASYTLGIAIQATNGAFSTGGSATISSGAGATNTWSSTRSIHNKYNYRTYQNDCTLRKTHRPESVHSYFTYVPTVARTDYSTCSTYSSGSYWKSNGTNFTQTAGVAFPGIKLNSQTGWNSKVRVAWKFNSRARLCASSSLGWASASWAGARPS